ncbi:MAG: response regulator [Nitrospinae bacterium]|nr:response regulator [Nitrospinota bacterium]
MEDNPANLRLVEQILAEDLPEIHVLSAPQAQMGLDLARAHRPGLILMDINLPGMDGRTAFKKLKTFEETRDIPVVAISANAMKKDIEDTLAMGFREYMVKPVDPGKLVKLVERYLALKP